jgi:REP element-mobilizing transposase RayT
MPRHNRSYHPGGVFHLTSRTLGREHWLSDPNVRDEVAEFIGMAFLKTDAQLLAFAIMFNHVHLLVRQGMAPLSQLMQPLLRRTARRLNRVIGREGYIFERRYREHPCTSADHVRNAIVYIHRNPLEAGICPTAADYDWTSHGIYCGPAGAQPPRACRNAPTVSAAVNLFASAPNRSREQLHQDYRTFFTARDLFIRHCNGDSEIKSVPVIPAVEEGDRCWAREFSIGSPFAQVTNDRPAGDLTDLLRRVLKADYPDITLEELQSRRGGATFVAARHHLIRRAVQAKHRRVKIATVLQCSETTVSRVAAQIPSCPPAYHGYRSVNA